MIIDDFEMNASFQNLRTNLATHKKLTFKRAYSNWRNVLTERIINIFEWSNLPMPQKEIEILLHYIGFCGFTRFRKSKELGVVYGSMSGVTNYPDIFTTFTYATPLESGMRKIDTNLIVINNNQLRMPTYQMVETYATLLAHTDLSLQAILINSRATGLVRARTQQQVDDIANWYNSLANGKTLAILDSDDLNTLMNDEGIKVFSMSYPSSMTIDSYYQIRENLLKSFYSEIGINSNRDKRERVVQAELDTNLNRILFNIDDMLKSREDACEQINKIFNTNISVKLNREIIEQVEIEPKQIVDAIQSHAAKEGDLDGTKKTDKS